jgi:two-component system, cell cycle sensor histidine kinase and response regulator CckA
VTDRKRLEARLLHAHKMESVGRLTGGVAHDFNNLLTVILGATSVAVGDLGEGSPAAEPLSEVLRAAERAADLTRQLLAFSRQQILQPRTLDLNSWCRESRSCSGA